MVTSRFPLFLSSVFVLVVVSMGACIDAAGPLPGEKSRPLFPIIENGKYGYIDQAGKVVIKPQFDMAKRFSEGLARVKVGDKWGFIDQTGKMIIQPQFDSDPNNQQNDSRLDFHEGMASVTLDKGSKWGYIDKTGRVQIEPQFSIARSFHEELACVRPGNTDEWGYIDKTGKMVIRLRHVPGERGPGDFSEGLALMQGLVSGELGFIDKTGAFAIEPKFLIAGRFSDGVAGACLEDKTANSGEGGATCGYIDRTGQWIIKQLSDVGPMSDFHEGLALVCGKDFCGYINKKGSYVWRSTESLANQHFDPTRLVGCTLWNFGDPEYGKDNCRN